MDFTLSAEQQALVDTTRKFAAAELPDLARTIEKNNSPPPRSLLKRYAELGLMGINLPAEYGGAGMGHLEAVLALEELAKISGHDALADKLHKEAEQRRALWASVTGAAAEPAAGACDTDIMARLLAAAGLPKGANEAPF